MWLRVRAPGIPWVRSPVMESTQQALQAARAVLGRYGIESDRTEVLQDANTLVVRLNETLVARVVQGADGLRKSTEWFEREIAVAEHLTLAGAPVIPLHRALPPGPHLHAGYPMNFWEYVQATQAPVDLADAGSRLALCHQCLRSLQRPLPVLAILEESLRVAERVEKDGLLEPAALAMLRGFVRRGLRDLHSDRMQILHGDAHLGNLLPTTRGLLWTDWEDAFVGPVEWDVASAVWNARFLHEDTAAAESFLAGYRAGGGSIRPELMEACFEARAAVISIWYPVLYPHPDPARREKLTSRLRWLAARAPLQTGT